MVCVPLCLKKMRTGSVAVAEKQQIRDSEKRGQECANEHLARQVAIVLQKQVQHIEGYYDSAHACVPVQCKWLQPLCSATAWKPGRKGRFDMLVNMQACMHDSFEAWVLLYDLAVRWVWKNVLMTMCMHYALCQVESCLKAGSGGLSSKTSWERDWQQTPATKTTTTTTRRALAIWGKLSLFYMFGSGLYGHRLLLDLEKKNLDSTESVKIACALQCMHDPLKPTRMVVTIIRDHWNAE